MSLSWFSMKRGTWVEDLMYALSRCVLSLMSSTVKPSSATSLFASSASTKLTSARMAAAAQEVLLLLGERLTPAGLQRCLILTAIQEPLMKHADKFFRFQKSFTLKNEEGE